MQTIIKRTILYLFSFACSYFVISILRLYEIALPNLELTLYILVISILLLLLCIPNIMDTRVGFILLRRALNINKGSVWKRESYLDYVTDRMYRTIPILISMFIFGALMYFSGQTMESDEISLLVIFQIFVLSYITIRDI
jgi:hypothetical protein